MDLAVYLPLLLGIALAVVTPSVVRVMPPRTGMWCLTAGAVIAAANWFAFLVIIAFTGLGRISFVASQGHWSAARWRGLDPVGIWTARAAGVVLIACLGWFAVTFVRQLSARRAVRALNGGFGTDETLVIVDDEAPHAYSIGGRRPRIVISRGLLQELSAAERRAVLSHEAAHVQHHHDVHLLVVRLAAAMNPMLHRFVATAVFAVERWADEQTATVVGDRRLVARTLVRAALAGVGSVGRPDAALAHAASDVHHRVTALLAGPPRQRWSVTSATTLLLLATLMSPLLAANNLTALLDRASSTAPAVHTTAHGRRSVINDGR